MPFTRALGLTSLHFNQEVAAKLAMDGGAAYPPQQSLGLPLFGLKPVAPPQQSISAVGGVHEGGDPDSEFGLMKLQRHTLNHLVRLSS